MAKITKDGLDNLAKIRADEPQQFDSLAAADPASSPGFSQSEESTSVAVPHPSVRPKPLDATGGATFRVSAASAEATLASLHALLDDSFHAVAIGLLPEGCKLEIVMVP